MTRNKNDFAEFVLDQLTSIADVSQGHFFGGVALKTGSVQFAMLMGDSLYFVVDDTTRPKFEHMGSRCFSYDTKKGRVDVGKYYEVPGEIVEDSGRLAELARESIAIARRLNKKK